MFLWLLIDFCRFPHSQPSGSLASVCLPCLWFFCVNVFVFVNAILTRGGCRKCLWQVMTAYEDAGCVFAEKKKKKKRSFSGLLNVSSVCAWTLSTGLECVFISTHVRTYCKGKDDVLPDAAERNLQDWEPLSDTVRDWYPLVLFVCFSERFSGNSETLVYSQLLQRGMQCTCFSMQL